MKPQRRGWKYVENQTDLCCRSRVKILRRCWNQNQVKQTTFERTRTGKKKWKTVRLQVLLLRFLLFPLKTYILTGSVVFYTYIKKQTNIQSKHLTEKNRFYSLVLTAGGCWSSSKLTDSPDSLRSGLRDLNVTLVCFSSLPQISSCLEGQRSPSALSSRNLQIPQEDPADQSEDRLEWTSKDLDSSHLWSWIRSRCHITLTN